ncbi:type VI secretion system-associated FHA domain protein TagH [Marinimicrobium sp. C6131]|uniref:type VI secretion system-associated FHA domain protein TagH n=1 Tax=Marinimicrobium sp. C6131 TaxID=3022676 RepID=UPI00223CE783|nr:type VI secretion system-associated FHA domain protein TagH [Marinimicrobium sp. C6131]UZJ44264.1 type VI secretion system-associated FHA domain protein TagH [Marinimicrobium sp. C6131]
MNLQLRMIKTPEGASLPQQQFSFDQHGGTIGRGPDNHWVLPDPDRILSARHCEFTVEQGRFQLIDHSTNGTFINGSSEPLGKGVVTTVNHGDQVEIGDYTFAIDLLNAESGSVDVSPFAAAPAPEEHSATPFSVDDPFACDPFDAGPVADPSRDSLDPLQMLDGASGTEREPWQHEPSELSPGPRDGAFSDSEPKWQDPSVDAINWPEAHQEQLIPTDWLEPAEREPAWVAAPEGMDAQPWDEPAGHDGNATHETPGPVVTPQPGKRSNPDRPAPVNRTESRAVSPDRSAAGPMPPRTSEALFSAMGVDLDRLSPEARRELEPLIGTMVREVIEGLMQVLRSRASIKNEFRMNVTTIQPVENNPLKFSADVDEALENIFVRQSQAYKEPLQAVREGFQEIAEHQLAMISGMRRAFEHMFKEFDPDRLETNANSQQKPSVMPPLRKARYWDNYRAHYQGLSDNMERSFQQIFGDEFVQAYQDQLRRLSALRP